jgi:DNA-binding beta-propeller fold protein YncE
VAACAAGSNGALGGEFSFPEGVAGDPAGNIYIADTNRNRVQKLDSSGKALLAFGKNVGLVEDAPTFDICTQVGNCVTGTASSLTREFDLPTAVAADAVGDVYVADSRNARIQELDSWGNFLRVIASGGGHAGELNFPEDVVTDAAGSLYVADNGNNRIQKFDSHGNFVLAFGKDVVTAATSASPGRIWASQTSPVRSCVPRRQSAEAIVRRGDFRHLKAAAATVGARLEHACMGCGGPVTTPRTSGTTVLASSEIIEALPPLAARLG